MLTIIHGSDTALSRKYFLDEKQKLKDAILIEAEKVDLTELAQLFEGGGLFGETKYLFIEQLLTKRKKSSDFKDILTYLEKNAGENTIFLWEGKELERGTLNALKKAVVRTFKFPQTLFQLLDAILPDNNKTLIKLFHQTIETTEPEMIFFMPKSNAYNLGKRANWKSKQGFLNQLTCSIFTTNSSKSRLVKKPAP